MAKFIPFAEYVHWCTYQTINTRLRGTLAKFIPIAGTDTMVNKGTTWTINTRLQCITAMKEYENKSLEELRVEDYLAGRKGQELQTTGFGIAFPVTSTQQSAAFSLEASEHTGFGTTILNTDPDDSMHHGQYSPPAPVSIGPLRWYWQDSDDRWIPFEPESLQQTLERKFKSKQRIYLFSRENYKWSYSVDFHLMTQKNLDTGKIRKLKRCSETNVSCHDEIASTTSYPAPLIVIDDELPPSWVPWDLAHPFERVQLQHSDADYIKVSDKFYQTMSPHQHVLQAVFRIQNHTLWSSFCNRKKSMRNNQRRLGDTNDVDKRYLFHGTDSLDAVRGICINNFDFRLCGKKGTKYGQGAYFARDAEYSHGFTKPSVKLERYMFQATVLVGYYTTGKAEYKRPPEKPGKDHELYDSCVDKKNDPSIFILFDKTAYYPEYLIQYIDTGDLKH